MKEKTDDKPISNSKNKNLFLIYIRMVLGIIGVFALFASLGLFVYARLTGETSAAETSYTAQTYDGGTEQTQVPWDGKITGGVNIIEAPDKTNFLIALISLCSAIVGSLIAIFWGKK